MPNRDTKFNPELMRKKFQIDSKVVFLNHGSFGACPREVFENYQRWQCELERQPVEFIARKSMHLMLQARKDLACFLNVDHPNIVFVPNATHGLNTVIKSIPLNPGDEILSTDHEYGAIERAWDYVCKKTGARFIRQKINLPLIASDDLVEKIWQGVTAKTRVLFLSHISAPTAMIFPIAELIKRARSLGIITIIDGAHASGQLDLDLSALDVDYYCGNCHKWMLAPKGAAFLYARPEMQDTIIPLAISWGDENKVSGASRFVDELEYQGTIDIASYLSVSSAIEFCANNNWPEQQKVCHQRLSAMRNEVSRITNMELMYPDSTLYYAQMHSFELPDRVCAITQNKLFAKYGVEVPLIEWNGRCLIRISVQAYNTDNDLDAFIELLKKI
jgi:isopenicillin-N epimerase